MRSADWAPLRFRDRTLDGYHPATDAGRRALEAARKFVDGGINGLGLAGPTGVGKTHLAVAAAQARYLVALDSWQAAVDAMPPVPDGMPRSLQPVKPRRPDMPSWCSVPELIVGLRADMDRQREERAWGERVEELAAEPGIVVLDDLGREKVSDWTGETIYVLLNGRYERMLPTIVTTNLPGGDLAVSPYWPCISRLAEDGELVRLDGTDWRLPRKARATA